MHKEYERQKITAKVTLLTADGQKHDVHVLMNHGDVLSNYINSDVKFIEVEDEQKRKVLIAKSYIQSLTPRDTEKAGTSDQIGGEKWRHHSQDPYVMLDIGMDASDDEIRNAYLKLARAYHPDRMASLDLPAAMLQHGEDILKKINGAYEAIQEKRRTEKKTA